MSNGSTPVSGLGSRRVFLGWLVSVTGATLSVFFLAATEGVLSTFRDLLTPFRRNTRPGHNRAKRARLLRKKMAAHVTSNSQLIIIEHHFPRNMLQSSVVHWPNEKLFKRRLLLRPDAPILQGDKWKERIHPHCDPHNLKPLPSTTHFYAAHDGVIREQLAIGVSFCGFDRQS